MKRKQLITVLQQSRVFNVGISLASILLTFLVLESSLRIYHLLAAHPGEVAVPKHIISNSPYLYGLNPRHPEINSQGLRDNKIVLPKPAEEKRILILGDSVTYGAMLPSNATFSQKLERQLHEEGYAAQVINAGVTGYTTFNEVQYYLSAGWKFEADLVMVIFCMNDIADPMLHWGYTQERISNIPLEAIPNIEYHQQRILPLVQERRKLFSLKRSELYDTLHWRMQLLLYAAKLKIPTYVTGEDSLSITVLLDTRSPEWIWLTRLYDRLHRAVVENGSEFMIVFVPLAYQLDSNYPFFPQKLLMTNYCDVRDIVCLDLLESFQAYPKEELFFLEKSGFYDVWHLSERGQQLVADILYKIVRNKFGL